MPRLPDATALGGRPVPQSNRRITSDRSGAIIGQALTGLGGTVAQIGGAQMEREDRFAYAQARSTLLAADMEARKELENDPDWQTHEQRYRDRMGKARDKATSLVRGSERSIFEQDSSLDIERGAAAIRQVAKGREMDSGRASLTEELEGLRTSALNATDEPSRAARIQLASDMITGAFESGYIDAEERVKAREQFTSSYAEGLVAVTPLEDRIAMLSNPKGTAMEFIAPDRRALLLKAAQNENRELTVRANAQAAEDKIFAAGGSLESMRTRARSIEDPEVRDSTLTRLEARFANVEQDRNQVDRDLRRTAWDVVLEGGTWDDIPADVVSTMNPEDALSVRNYLSQGGEIKTDTETWYTLKQMQGAAPAEFAEFDLLTVRHLLSESDFQTFAGDQQKIGSDLGKGYAVQTDNQLVEAALEGMGIATGAKAKDKDITRAAAFRYSFEQQLTGLQREQGTPPTSEQKHEIIDRLSMEAITDRGILSDTTKRIFELGGEPILDIVVPKAERKEIVAAIERKNKARNAKGLRTIDPTEEVILEMYLAGRGILPAEGPPELPMQIAE